jgi:hypothetical protein
MMNFFIRILPLLEPIVRAENEKQPTTHTAREEAQWVERLCSGCPVLWENSVAATPLLQLHSYWVEQRVFERERRQSSRFHR